MSADPYRGEVAVHRPNDGATIVLTRNYLEAGGMDHGYALTLHASQGLTVQRSHVLANDALFYEAGLVALSRHRDICQIYLAGPVLVDDREVSHVRQQSQRDVIPASDQLDNLSAALRTSRADEAALDHVEEPLRPDRFDGRTVR
jgi:ATP-dependent exoDNAse (exonuclease V) alpha subunit